MPNYKTHSIHGEIILNDMDKKIDINPDKFKAFCMGPDALITTDYFIFDYQHANKVKEYFESMLKYYKKNKLYNDSEAMAFLYGQIDHYILDVITHPFIYYITEGMEVKYKFKPHGLIENWIDDYIISKYGKDKLIYYRSYFLKNKKLKKVIDRLYERVYSTKHESLKYNIGIMNTSLYDLLIRKNLIGITPLIIKATNMGDIMYKKDLDRIIPYLNLNNNTWYNPETGMEYNYSFDDLWNKSIEEVLQTIDDINNYLYSDKHFNNKYISNDISFNTGRPCEEGQSFKFIKKY